MATAQMETLIRHLRRAVLTRGDAAQSDGELLTAFIHQKDEAAFEALVRRHGSMVFGVCRRIVRNHHDAEDAFQATFLVLARKAGSVQPCDRVANFLYGVAQRTALKARAMTAIRHATETNLAPMPEPEAPGEDEWRDLRPLLDQELENLPEPYRLAVLLCDLEGKSIKEATQHLGWPQGTLASRLARGRKLLAKRLTNRGVTLSAGALAAGVSQNVASAGVRAALMSSTVKAATLMAEGQMAAGVVPARVAALTEGVMKSMMLTKLSKAGAACLVVLCLCCVGIGVHAVMAGELKPTQPRAAQIDTPQQAEPATVKATEVFRKRWPGREVTWAIDLSPDGRLVLSSHWGGVRLWEVATGKVVREWTDAGLGHFTRDGRRILINVLPDAKRNQLRLYETASGKLIRQFGPHPGGLWNLTVSPDGKSAVTAGDDRVGRQWDLSTGELVATNHAGDWPDRVKLWGGKEVPEFQKRTGVIPHHVLPGGREVLGAHLIEDRFAPVYEIRSGRLVRKISLGGPGKVEVLGCAAHYLGQCFAYSLTDSSIVVLDLAAGKEVARFPSGLSAPKLLAISTDGRSVAACAHNEKSEVVVWRLAEPNDHRGRALARSSRLEKEVSGVVRGSGKAHPAGEEEQEETASLRKELAAKEDLLRLQGAWKPISGEYEGKEIDPKEDDWTLEFTGEKVVQLRKGRVHVEGNVELANPTTTCKRAYWKYTNVPVTNSVLYYFVGRDTLITCWNGRWDEGVAEWPTGFVTGTPGTGVYLVVWKRQ